MKRHWKWIALVAALAVPAVGWAGSEALHPTGHCPFCSGSCPLGK